MQDEEWQIDDISNDPQVINEIARLDRKSKFHADSILTNPEMYETVVELVYEVN